MIAKSRLEKMSEQDEGFLPILQMTRWAEAYQDYSIQGLTNMMGRLLVNGRADLGVGSRKENPGRSWKFLGYHRFDCLTALSIRFHDMWCLKAG